MSRPPLTPEIEPWYRQGWPWLLIALPASAVLGGIITLLLAVQSPNALVVDDYYKEGLAINQHKQRLQAADDLGLEGLLRNNGTRLTLSLSSTTPVTADALRLQLIHSTRSDLDREVTLQRTGAGRYSGRMRELLPGTWYLRLGPGDAAWEIRARVATDGPFQANLTPDP
ncbi:MAG: FixH family protein [Gammaproteobacteria bacterium]|jgi:hypothetical protein